MGSKRPLVEQTDGQDKRKIQGGGRDKTEKVKVGGVEGGSECPGHHPCQLQSKLRL